MCDVHSLAYYRIGSKIQSKICRPRTPTQKTTAARRARRRATINVVDFSDVTTCQNMLDVSDVTTCQNTRKVSEHMYPDKNVM